MKENCLLFSKQCCHKHYKYRLYFVYLPTMYSDTPRIHRFVVRSAKVFNACKLGDVYTLYYKKIKIKEMEFEESYPLTDEEYMALMDLRDYIFPCEEILDELNLSEEMSFHEKYHSLSEYRKILSYPTQVSEHIATLAINTLVNALSMIIPALLFVLYVFNYALALTNNNVGSNDMLALPLIIVLVLPFVIFLMTLLYHVGNAALYKFPYTKWVLIKRHLVKYGGYRNQFFLTRNQLKKLISFGIISGLVFVASMILANVLF